ncbi:MAG: triose-phosphate isomerase [Oscillospiraceae bacterium]|nr:triose-phosphate isomerase [Oscillospiraceae bacterium]
MLQGRKIRAPFFEIGPKQYLYGEQIIKLALAADAAAEEFDVDVVFTTPFCDIRSVAEATKRLFVFAPHMDAIGIGRGLADILPESVKAAGAEGVMLNHAEKPISFATMQKTIARAAQLNLQVLAIADSIEEARAVAGLNPTIVIAEQSELIGSGVTADKSYITATTNAIKGVNPDILVLQAAGIKDENDVYKMIFDGAEATGTSSAVGLAPDPGLMARRMICAVRRAWDDRN